MKKVYTFCLLLSMVLACCVPAVATESSIDSIERILGMFDQVEHRVIDTKEADVLSTEQQEGTFVEVIGYSPRYGLGKGYSIQNILEDSHNFARETVRLDAADGVVETYQDMDEFFYYARHAEEIFGTTLKISNAYCFNGNESGSCFNGLFIYFETDGGDYVLHHSWEYVYGDDPNAPGKIRLFPLESMRNVCAKITWYLRSIENGSYGGYSCLTEFLYTEEELAPFELEAMKAALQADPFDPDVPVLEPPVISETESEPSPDPKPQDTPQPSPWLWCVPVAAVLAVGGAVTVVVMRKKRKKDGNE